MFMIIKIFGNNPKWTMFRIFLMIGLFVVFFKVLFFPIRVTGDSMIPSYHDGQIKLVYRYAYKKHKPVRGDVVAIKTKKNQKYCYLKRIIGVPGEIISIQSGTIYIGGVALNEKYVKYQNDWNMDQSIRLKKNQYFVIGDNRQMAIEDHALGKINLFMILGKVI